MIRHLKLKDFKSIKYFDHDLKHLNILSGSNGSGKSTLCQSIMLMKNYYSTFSIDNDKRFNLNTIDIELGKGEDVLYENADEDKIELSISTAFSADTDEDIATEKLSLDVSDKSLDYLKVINVNNNNLLYTNNIEYLKAERIGPRLIQNKDDLMVIEKKSIGTSGEYTFSYLENYGPQDLEQIENRVHKNSYNDTLIEQVTCWLGEISNNIKFKTREIERTNLINLSYSYNRKTGESNQIRATNVGFGISYILPVITMCLKAEWSDTIIIDTPEAHLHPKGQVAMGELLAKTAADGVQVIVETHSDHIINGIRKAILNENIEPKDVAFFHFSLEEDEISSYSKIHTPMVDKSGGFDNWPDGFFDEWMITNKELFRIRSSLDD